MNTLQVTKENLINLRNAVTALSFGLIDWFQYLEITKRIYK